MNPQFGMNSASSGQLTRKLTPLKDNSRRENFFFTSEENFSPEKFLCRMSRVKITHCLLFIVYRFFCGQTNWPVVHFVSLPNVLIQANSFFVHLALFFKYFCFRACPCVPTPAWLAVYGKKPITRYIPQLFLGIASVYFRWSSLRLGNQMPECQWPATIFFFSLFI